MNFSFLRKSFFLVSVVIAFVNSFCYGQLTVNSGVTPTFMVQNVLMSGGGLTATGITYTGSPNARGTFNGSASNIGFNSGILLTSGNLTNAIGPNNMSGASLGNLLPGDPDLNIIMSPTLSYDATILEFDFVATSDTIKFNYVFGSEEYMEFVSTTPGGINDGFGFFISGPGISGPFSGGAQNIAIIPGTSLPVTMFNLNLYTNAAYYFDNGDGFGTGTAPDGLTIQYDGFTVPLEAVAAVQCGQTYHIKMAIADGGDDILDSGVFIEEGSFVSTGNVFMSSSTSFGGLVSGNDTTIYEGCGFASVLFDRGTNNLAVADTFYFTLSGTATNGLDYTSVSDSIYFAVGQDSAYVTINSLPDGLIEGTETVILTVYASTPCGNDTATLTLLIIDSPPISVSLNNDTTLSCPFSNLPLTAVASGGVAVGSYTYSWTNTTSTTSAAVVNPTITTTYVVTVTDSCGNAASDSVTVTIIPYTPLQLTVSNDTTICGGNSVLLDANPSFGLPDYIYSWSPSVTIIDSVTVTPAASTTYTVTVTDDCGLTITDTIAVTVFPIHADFDFTLVTNQSLQFNNQSSGAISYFWNFGDGSEDSVSTDVNPSHDYINDGTYTVMLIATNVEGCADTVYQTIVVLPDFYFYFPNAFTPNANGNNDLFMGYGAGIKKYNMKIYDRWGELLFETNDLNTGWDGTYKGQKAPSAVYAVIFDLEGYRYQIVRRIGSVTLVR
ncbi:MAG: choice-of-anchor L domain-containing protein [Bacteroidetes bacterium]|nr:choice-of-anchor L domain-containing protein [Bacteroidota bacterium]